jgi:glycosyltransferase involved in cell wall biosynthesis
MKISVVIPLYNKSLYISRTINSVLNQMYPAHEILIINDGSTDNSYDIAQKFLAKDPRIKLFTQENKGASYSRNRGVALAASDHIAFLDADDEWKPDYLTHINRLYNNFPDCGAYATCYEVIRDNEDNTYPILVDIPPEPWIGIITNLFKLMQKANPFYTSSIVINKSVFRERGGFPIGVKRGEDLVLWIRLGVRYHIAYSPSRQVLYHTEAENRVCNIFPSFDKSAVADEIAEMLENNQIPNDLLDDLQEFYYLLNIKKAKEILSLGDIKTAKLLLKKAKMTETYRAQYLLWYFWSRKLPYRLLPFAKKCCKIWNSIINNKQAENNEPVF